MSEITFKKAAEEGGALLFRLMRSLAAMENGESRCCGLTVSQGLALLAMAPGGLVTMRQLAEALAVSAGTATRMVDNLVRDGLVERTANQGDRRYVCVRPTARGERTIKELEECYRRFWTMTFRSIPTNRLGETLAALELLVDAVEKAEAACCRTFRTRSTHIKQGVKYELAKESG